MIWLVWNSDGETEADALRIDAQDCVEAAEEWARRDLAEKPDNYEKHLRGGLNLHVRLDNKYGAGRSYRVQVRAEATINYFGKEG